MFTKLIVYLVAGIIVSFTNCTFILVILSNRKLRNTSNLLLVSLSFSDMFVGCFSAIFSASVESDPFIAFDESLKCKTIVVMLLAFPSVSVLHMTSAALERYVTILYPLKYSLILSKRKIAIAVLICWLGPLIGLTVASSTWTKIETNIGNDSHFRCSMDALTPCPVWDCILSGVIVFYVFAVILYVRVFFVAVSQVRKVTSQTGENRYRTKVLRAQIKVAFLLFIVTGLFAFSYLPLSIALRQECTENGTAATVLVLEVFGCLVFANAGLNPLIYGLGNRTLRRAFIGCFSKCKRSSIAAINTR